MLGWLLSSLSSPLFLGGPGALLGGESKTEGGEGRGEGAREIEGGKEGRVRLKEELKESKRD